MDLPHIWGSQTPTQETNIYRRSANESLPVDPIRENLFSKFIENKLLGFTKIFPYFCSALKGAVEAHG